MQSSNLLSIAIPHYDDVYGLTVTLDAIIGQRLNHFDILISDNGSPKGTEQLIMETYATNMRSLRFFQNNENLGYDKNIDLCIQRASGHFVWLLGCGDIPEVRDPKKFAELLEKNQQAVNLMPLVVNETGDYSQTEQRVDDESLIVIQPSTFLNDFYNSGCSGNIINRSKAIHACRKPLTSKNWCHVERILQTLVFSGERSFAVKTDVCKVTMTIPQDGWWTHDDEVFLLNFLSHREIIKKYHKEKALGICQLPRFSESKLLLLRAILFSKQVDNRAPFTTRSQVDMMIQENRAALVLNVAARNLPKKLIRLLYLVGANLLTVLGLKKYFRT